MIKERLGTWVCAFYGKRNVLSDVLSCQRKDGIAVHVTNKPLDVGSQVKVVVDWKRYQRKLQCTNYF